MDSNIFIVGIVTGSTRIVQLQIWVGYIVRTNR
jgi:hypothetical protein